MASLYSAIDEIAKLAKIKTIVIKSTVPVGTNREISLYLKKKKWALSRIKPRIFKEGSAIEDFMKPDRIIVGKEKAKVYDRDI